jgi:hypothetical protein
MEGQKKFRVSGVGVVTPKKQQQESSEKIVLGPGYWKTQQYSSTSLLLDDSERKKHVKDYSTEVHDKKTLIKQKRLDGRRLGAGDSSVKYVPHSR